MRWFDFHQAAHSSAPSLLGPIGSSVAATLRRFGCGAAARSSTIVLAKKIFFVEECPMLPGPRQL